MLKLISFLTTVLILSSCKSQDWTPEMLEQDWIAEMETELGETSNLIFSLKNGKGHFAEIGQSPEAFSYVIRDNKILITEPTQRYLKILSCTSDSVALGFSDSLTLVFSRIKNPIASVGEAEALLHGQTFLIDFPNDAPSRYIHFLKEEIFLLSKDILNEEKKFRPLWFRRGPYKLANINGIVTINMSWLKGEINYPFFGIFTYENDKLSVKTYLKNGEYEAQFDKPVIDVAAIKDSLLGKWVRGLDKNARVFELMENGKLLDTKDGIQTKKRWSLDSSGFLIKFEDEQGKINYGVNDIMRTDYRMGYEFQKGKFQDLLRRKKK